MTGVILLIVACTLSIIAYVIYYLDIKNSYITPNRYSWIIWSFATLLETLTYNDISGDIIKSACFFVSAFSCIAITLKIWASSEWTKPNFAELISLLFCFGALTIWFAFNSVWYAHVLLLAAIPIAFIPTYKNVIRDFNNENSKAWLIWSISDILVLTIIFLRFQTVEEIPYAITEFVCHLSVFVLLVFYKIKQSSKGFIVKKNHKGMGVYSNRNFKRNEILIKFKGKLFHKTQIPTNMHGVNDHYMQVGIDLYLGPSGRIDDYFNHSCKPNAGLLFKDNEIYLTAIDDIKKDEEITWDYSTTLFDTDWTMHCDCNEPNCRKIVSEFNLLDKDLQQKYLELNVIAPYLKHNIQQT